MAIPTAADPLVVPIRINGRELLTTIDHTRIQRLPVTPEIKTLIDRGWVNLPAITAAARTCHRAKATLRHLHENAGTALTTYRHLFPEDRIENPSSCHQ